MTLEDMKIKVYTMIEEYSEDADDLSTDPDLVAKINTVINQIQNELTRFKKIPAYTTRDVTKGETISLTDIDNRIYQIGIIRDVDYDMINDTITFNEDGTAKIYYFKYPKRITPETDDSYKFELTDDLLEIMPYGVAGDLLKSDVSSQYGSVYSARYREMLNTLDPRYSNLVADFTGGIKV